MHTDPEKMAKLIEAGTPTRFTSETAPGRPKNAGSTLQEWYNAMAEWSEDEIEDAAKHPKSTAAKKAAANRWLRAIAGPNDLDAIEDRTNGKATQTTVNKVEIMHVRRTVIHHAGSVSN